MYKYEITFRTLYADTDQMRVIYYGNYPKYYEMGRVEAMRNLGVSYAKLEEQNIFMPVVGLNIRYKSPLVYDEQVRLVTIIPELPSTKIIFQYEIYNENNELCNTGETVLVFMDSISKKVIRVPDDIIAPLTSYYEKH